MVKKNGNGFTIIEVFIASSLFLSTILIFIPIISSIQKEQVILADRREISIGLQEELQFFIWETGYQLPIEKTEIINGKLIYFLFTEANQFVKGCVHWENAKQKEEEFCLYGLAVN